MRIYLIIPPSPNHRRIIRNIDCSHESKADYLWHPNDMMVLSSLAKDQDEVIFVDGTADKLEDTTFFQEIDSQGEPDLVFMTLSSAAWASDYEYFLKLHAKFESQPFFVLGDIFLEEPYQQKILEKAAGIVMAPYLVDLEQLKAGVENPAGIVTQPGQKMFSSPTKPTYLEANGFPRHELFMKKGYCFPFAQHHLYATVTVMWGCPMACSYCTDANFPPFVRNIETVLDEMETLKVKEIFFSDKIFGYPAKVSKPFLRAMAERFDFSFSCYFHPQHYDEELLDLMHKAGCHTIIIGIDSADLSSLKLYNRSVNQEKLNSLLEHANRLKISVCADFILGLRHETAEEVQKTVDYALSLPLDFASFNIAAPLPGSVFRKEAEEQGLISFNDEGHDTLGTTGIIGHTKMDSDKILEIRNRAVKRFYLRPSYILRRLSRTKSIEHLMIQFRQAKGMMSKGLF